MGAEAQQGTVLIRVPAVTRNKLQALRQKKYPDSEWNSEIESLGGLVTRLTDAEAERQAKNKITSAAAAKVNKRRRSKLRRRRATSKHRARRKSKRAKR